MLIAKNAARWSGRQHKCPALKVTFPKGTSALLGYKNPAASIMIKVECDEKKKEGSQDCQQSFLSLFILHNSVCVV